MLSRRTFVSWLGGLGAAARLGLRPRDASAAHVEPGVPPQSATLDAVVVTRLGDVVLPGELGDAGIARVSRAFTQWVAAYRVGAELVHPYGSADIRRTPESPAARWRAQLADLERSARATYRRGFLALTREERRALVMQAIANERTNRMPDPLDANHVALALAAWFYSSSEANDLCYRARIGRNQCRPLVNAPRQPLPLAQAGRSGDARS